LRGYLKEIPEFRNAPNQKPIEKADRQDLLGRMIRDWESIFDKKLSKIFRTYVHELKEVRNMDAHDELLTLENVRRYIDTLVLFLEGIKSPELTTARKLLDKIQDHIQSQKNCLISPLSETLYVIQCSKTKGEFSLPPIKGDIFDGLTEKTAKILKEMQEKRMTQEKLDQHISYPAYKGYQGPTYKNAEDALQDAVMGGGHILIVSGVYGLVRASETIHRYNANFIFEDWTYDGKNILIDAITEYLQHFKLKHIRLLFTNGPYSKVGKSLGSKVNFLDSALLFSFSVSPKDKYVHLKNTGTVLKELLLFGMGNVEDPQAIQTIGRLEASHSLEVLNLLKV